MVKEGLETGNISCHSERSEESRSLRAQILRFAQNDTAITTRIAGVGRENSLWPSYGCPIHFFKKGSRDASF
jgi:hypothetical protein